MKQLEQHAYHSPLRHCHPCPKFFLAGTMILICLWADRLVISALALLIMTGITMTRGGVTPAAWLKMARLPLVFALLAALPVALDSGGPSAAYWLSTTICGIRLGVAKGGGMIALRLFGKAAAALSCLLYVATTTPMPEVLAALREMKVPAFLLEIFALAYRFVFILDETAQTMTRAQKARLGHASLRLRLRSAAGVASRLFLRSHLRLEHLYTALKARGYTGNLTVLQETRPHSWRAYLAPGLWITSLVLLACGAKWWGGRLP